MRKYHVIIVHDDNTIYRTYTFDTKKDAQQFAFDWTDGMFVVCIVGDDCFRHSDNAIIKKARKHSTKGLMEVGG